MTRVYGLKPPALLEIQGFSFHIRDPAAGFFEYQDTTGSIPDTRMIKSEPSEID